MFFLRSTWDETINWFIEIKMSDHCNVKQMVAFMLWARDAAAASVNQRRAGAQGLACAVHRDSRWPTPAGEAAEPAPAQVAVDLHSECITSFLSLVYNMNNFIWRRTCGNTFWWSQSLFIAISVIKKLKLNINIKLYVQLCSLNIRIINNIIVFIERW